MKYDNIQLPVTRNWMKKKEKIKKNVRQNFSGVVVIIVSHSLKFQWQFLRIQIQWTAESNNKRHAAHRNIQFNVEIEQIVNGPNAVKENAFFFKISYWNDEY